MGKPELILDCRVPYRVEVDLYSRGYFEQAFSGWLKQKSKQGTRPISNAFMARVWHTTERTARRFKRRADIARKKNYAQTTNLINAPIHAQPYKTKTELQA